MFMLLNICLLRTVKLWFIAAQVSQRGYLNVSTSESLVTTLWTSDGYDENPP